MRACAYSSAEHNRNLLTSAHDRDPPQAAPGAHNAIELARVGDPLIVDRNDAVTGLKAHAAGGRSFCDLDDDDAVAA